MVVAFKWILVVDATNDLVKMFVKCCNLKRFIHDMLPSVKPPGQGAGFLSLKVKESQNVYELHKAANEKVKKTKHEAESRVTEMKIREEK